MSTTNSFRRYLLYAFLGLCVIFAAGFLFKQTVADNLRYSDTDPGFEEVTEAVTSGASVLFDVQKKVDDLFEKTPQPLRVGIQAGHSELDNVPAELKGLKKSTGASGGGTTEAAAVLKIAKLVKTSLEEKGIVVDLLPATIPVDYVADAFISIHADGNANKTASGFKIAGPGYDFSGKADELVSALYESYGEATGLKTDKNITRRMSGYYAFNWRRYDHAIHPKTPAAIVETGFITSPTDRKIIVSKPEVAAKGITEGIVNFLDASRGIN